MKKIAYIILVLFALHHIVYSQNYLSVLKDDAEWSILHTESIPVGIENFTYNYYTEHYRLGHDSIIDGITWKTIYYSSDSTFNWDNPELKFGGLIREDNGKVYYQGEQFKYLADDGIIYNFSLQEGDIFWEGIDDTASPVQLFVYDVDTTFLRDNIPRRVLRLRYYYPNDDFTNTYDINVWIEGLGDLVYGLIEQRLPAGLDTNNPRASDRLICYKTQDTIVYQNDQFDDCFFEQITVGTKNPLTNNINVFPNPSSSAFNLTIDVNDPILFLRIFDQKGRLIDRFKASNGIGHYIIDGSDWPKGIYFLHLYYKNSYQSIKLLRL